MATSPYVCEMEVWCRKMNTVTIPGLIRHFENKISHEQFQLGIPMGKSPNFPMVVIFFGKEAIEGFKEVEGHLFEIWPPYRDKLLFLGVIKEGGSLHYSSLIVTNEGIKHEPISPNEIGNRVSALFGVRSFFQDRSRLLLYHVVDTTRLNNSSEFEQWITVMQDVRGTFVDRSLDALDMLIVLLNENIGERQAVSAQIRNALYRAKERLSYSTLLLSNRRSDHVILQDWESCYRIIANTIALTNNSDQHVARYLFDKRVYTAAYACERKPISQIGQVIVRQLIEKLSEENLSAADDILSDKQVEKKLGLSSDGTLELLDSYAEQYLYKSLPTRYQLELFPRKDLFDFDDISSFSEKEFNVLTMGSWNSFLEQIISQAQGRVISDSNIRTNWREQYSETLLSSFSINELMWLRDHIDDVKDFLLNARAPSSDIQVLSAAKERIKYMLSSNPDIIEIFLNIIKHLGDHAERFLEEWKQLLRSGLQIHSVRDENITQFYSKKARNFFDHNWKKLSDEFRIIKDMSALSKFLVEVIDSIVESDPIFSVPFEDELESRLKEEALSVNAKQYIRQKLTGESVPIYYRAQFNIGSPLVSCILIKVGTQLYSNMVNHLPDTTYYYDTGSGSSAEALNYYLVSADNLICEEN